MSSANALPLAGEVRRSQAFVRDVVQSVAVRGLVLVIIMLAAAGARAETPEQVLPAASGTDHLWFVTARASGDRPFVLRHHARSMRGPYFSAPVPMSAEPQALAVVGDRVWAVMPARELGESWVREVFTVQAVFEPAVEMYKLQPENRLALAPPLPGTGRLAGFVGTQRGPVALLTPHQHELLDRAGDASAAMPTLLQLRHEEWITVDLPSDLPRGGYLALGLFGDGRDQLIILAARRDDPTRTTAYRQQANGAWEATELALDLRQVISVSVVDGRSIVVGFGEAGPETLRIAYIRPTRLARLAELATPGGRWAAVGWHDGVRLIESSTRGPVHMTRIDAITGEVGERMAMSIQPLPSGRLWYVGLMLTVAVVAVILAVMIRPSAQQEIRLPKGLAPLPVPSRIAALVIDLAPGALLAVVILRAPPVELLRLPLTTESVEQSAAYFVMILVYLVHATMSEIFTARTIGKAMMGGFVTTQDGRPPGAGSLLVRAVMKLLILLVPPLAIFALFSPNLQGFNDLIARTVVVRRLNTEESTKTDE